MITARFAEKAYLAIIILVAALVFPQNVGAASGNAQVCSPNSSCSVGEFLYDDSYSPITTATCTITSRYPDGTLFLDSQPMSASAENDGWYSKNFTASATAGVYRTQVCCKTVSATFAPADVNITSEQITIGRNISTATSIKFLSTGTLPTGLAAGTKYYAINVNSTTIKVATSVDNAQAGTSIDFTDQGSGIHTIETDDNMCLDKTFEIKTESTLSSSDVTTAVWDAARSSYTTSGSFGEALQNVVPSADDVAGAVWEYSSRSLSTFGSLVSDVWTNPTRTLSGFGTLVADIWANATRTLTGAALSSGSLATKSNVDTVSTDVATVKNDVGTVKSDVSTIKSNVSDVKTDVSSAKSDISSAKSDISSVKTAISDVKKKMDDLTTTTTTTTNVTNVQNITNTTNNLLEQLINRPTLENVLEESSFTTTELQTKMEKSDSLANQLLTSGTYIKSKTNLIKGRLLADRQMGDSEIAKYLSQLEAVVGKEDDTSDKSSIFGQLNWIAEQWDFPISSKLYSQNKKIATSLKAIDDKLSTPGKVNSVSVQIKNLSTNLDNFIKLVGTDSDSPKSNTLFGQLKDQKELLSALDKNYTEAETLLSDVGKNTKPQTDLVAQINSLSTQVAAVNQLPKMNKNILAKANTKMDQKQLKNKTLSLRGILEANRQFLAQGPNRPLSSLWLEEGSIVFKTLISNPSKSISQKIPLKYYLPKEVTRENITKTDEELTVNYDAEKDQYYASGSFTLAQGETKTLEIIVDDSAFHINDQQIATMRKQAEELSKPLVNTAYFAQGVILKTDIDAFLDKIESLQKNGITPESKIRAYRESIIEHKAAEVKLDKLKELAANAGSVGTLFGFVGGAQVLAVWGLIIIMVAGFVFLALYMRTLRNSEKYSPAGQYPLPPIDDGFENYEEVLNKKRPEPANLSQKRFHTGKTVHLAAILLAVCIIGGGSAYALLNLRQKQIIAQGAIGETAVKPAGAPETVLGSSSGGRNEAPDSSRLDRDLYKEVNLFVPEQSLVSIHSGPSLQSTVLTTLSASKKAKEISRQETWVEVLVEDTNGKTTEGWVDQDFIEEIEKKQSQVPDSMRQTLDSDVKQKPQDGLQISQKMVAINVTPTGFLRVRKTPAGEEITKVDLGEEYPFVKEESGWVQIVLEDGTPGWVSKQYINF